MEAKIIPVFSNKGGVGKTFVAVNLAAALAVAGRKVLMLDLDVQPGHDMAKLLNLKPEQSIVNLLANTRESNNLNIDTIRKHLLSHNSGMDFISAVIDNQHITSADAKEINKILDAVTPHYDFVIIDLGVTFNEMMVSIMDTSDAIFLVATPDVLAVYQLTWCIKMLEEMHFPMKQVRFILNRDKSQGSVSWQEVKNALNIEIIGRVPSDGRGVGQAYQRGVPSVIDNPRGPIGDAFKRMVNDFKRSDLFSQPSSEKGKRNIDKNKIESIAAQEAVVEESSESAEGAEESTENSAELDEMTALKVRIQEKLIKRLDMDKLSPDHFSDPQKAFELKESAKKIIGTLLLEDGSTFVSSHEQRTKVVNAIVNETFGLGVLEEIMEDVNVEEVMVNGPNEIYIESKGEIILTDHKFLSNQQLRAIINRIIAPLGRRLDESSPMVDARLQDGSRFNAIIPPLSLSGVCVTIRKFAAEKLTVDHFVHRFRSISGPMRDFLQACVLGRMNIIVAGGTGSGKTSLLNVLSEFIPDDERIITIEDAAELSLSKEHWGRLESRPANVEGSGAVSVRDLFVNTLRMRPDRIVIGECRGPEVLDMLQAMNTGHDGSMTSLHANSTRDVLIRMSSMILLSGVELPMRAINEMISSAINVIVHMARFTDGSRKVTGITEITGIDDKHELILKDIFRFNQTGRATDGTIQGYYETFNYIPKIATELKIKGIKLDDGIFNSKPSPGFFEKET